MMAIRRARGRRRCRRPWVASAGSAYWLIAGMTVAAASNPPLAGPHKFVAAYLPAVGFRHEAPPRAPSLHLGSIDADVFYIDLPGLARRGSSQLVAVRLNATMDLVPHHYAHEGLAGPRPIGAWRAVLHAPIALNAGQFAPSLAYIGWLKSRGTWLNAARQPRWLGLIVSQPTRHTGPYSRIVDLARAEPSIVDEYANVMQSMMLVDETQVVRVRRSELAACRTVVAEDARGRLIIMMTRGAVVLHDLARWLPASGLGVVRAINLDGGVESQLAIDTPELALTMYGQYGTGATLLETDADLIHYPLPAVLAVHRACDDRLRASQDGPMPKVQGHAR